MPTSFNDSVVEAQFRYTFNNEDIMNTLWLRTVDDTPVVEPQLEPLANALLIWYEQNLIAIQHPTCQLREIFLRVATPDPAMVFTLSGDATDVGTAAGEALPGNVTLVVSFRTGLSGRSFRGRNYSVGMTESQQSAGIAQTTYFNALVAAYEDLPARLGDTTDFLHVVYSQFTAGAPRVLGLPTPVSAYVIIDANTDSQRRRNRGVGG